MHRHLKKVIKVLKPREKKVIKTIQNYVISLTHDLDENKIYNRLLLKFDGSAQQIKIRKQPAKSKWHLAHLKDKSLIHTLNRKKTFHPINVLTTFQQ